MRIRDAAEQLVYVMENRIYFGPDPGEEHWPGGPKAMREALAAHRQAELQALAELHRALESEPRRGRR